MNGEVTCQRLETISHAVERTAPQARLDLREARAEGLVSRSDSRDRLAVSRPQGTQRGIVEAILPFEMRLELLPQS